jgi:hypothetical protein
MGLILFITIGSLSCAFKLYVLTRRMEGKSKGKHRTKDVARKSKQPFLVRSANADETKTQTGTRRKARTGRDYGTVFAGGEESERSIHQRVASVLNTHSGGEG